MNRRALEALLPIDTPLSVIPTGCLSLDWALGCGGFPRGHLVEIFGPPDSGKTTLALEAIAAAQRQGGVAAFLDAEHALDLRYAAAVGIETEGLIYSQPTSAPQALEIVCALVRSCVVDVVVLDSVAALGGERKVVPGTRGELSSSGGDFEYWPFVDGLRRLHTLLSKSSYCAVILINQLRSRLKVEVGERETTTGAPALSMMATLRVRTERRAALMRNGESAGSRCAIRIAKNTLGRSSRQAEIEILANGICRQSDLVALGLRAGTIARTSDGLCFGSSILGASAQEACFTLQNSPRLYSALDRRLREMAGVGPKAAGAVAGS
ncbi:MAG: DNA recombination/repair protein RecA [Bryobacterales bacterium]|nr:DNA recombination/repair protein RecA [Bryobacterales bacterium]